MNSEHDDWERLAPQAELVLCLAVTGGGVAVLWGLLKGLMWIVGKTHW